MNKDAINTCINLIRPDKRRDTFSSPGEGTAFPSPAEERGWGEVLKEYPKTQIKNAMAIPSHSVLISTNDPIAIPQANKTENRINRLLFVMRIRVHLSTLR
jgi:hypothetical protein